MTENGDFNRPSYHSINLATSDIGTLIRSVNSQKLVAYLSH